MRYHFYKFSILNGGRCSAKIPTRPTAPQQEKAPQRAGPLLGTSNNNLLLRRVLLAGLIALTALLAPLSGILRLLARLLVWLSALLTRGLSWELTF